MDYSFLDDEYRDNMENKNKLKRISPICYKCGKIPYIIRITDGKKILHCINCNITLTDNNTSMLSKFGITEIIENIKNIFCCTNDNKKINYVDNRNMIGTSFDNNNNDNNNYNNNDNNDNNNNANYIKTHKKQMRKRAISIMY